MTEVEAPVCRAAWHTLPRVLRSGYCQACGRDRDGALPPVVPVDDPPSDDETPS